ncbi:Rv3235 family protein [Rhodococcus sp. SGAir0479]|uniref:Rv3235 family protein n=1 Tax=Rhodococcus sp. SGAir0479 TaxID=2567884 RepID=UPI0010CCC20F|nr:Rv3235 family protein [Rhodococcus sp. SGAir0479]QCQ91991.1 hypothetical protein E7742_12710 [Rhodococcus sp. SGAir0479]
MHTEHRFLSPAPRFEPPAHDTRTPRRRRPLAESAVRRTPHDGRSPRPTVPRDATAPDVRRFAEHALRLTLEVIDRRRTPAQLRAVAAPAVIDVVHALVRSGPARNRLGSASLVGVHVRAAGADAAEVFGTYNRSGRVFAVAARIERGNGRHPAGWAITSLQTA